MARKRRKQQPFATANEPKQEHREHVAHTDGTIFGFMRDYGIRETVESIIVAVVLALMFRAYEAEAFIIPTGSMAPTLQGQHMDVCCHQCKYQYRAGASLNGSSTPRGERATITKTYCPICRYGMKMEPNKYSDHSSFNGDRILVNKFVYDFQPPERFDVIVFKNPNNGKQNYIKRLVGLPGDRLILENGDVYNLVPTADGKIEKQIIRKPADKIDVIMQLVDDTDYIPSQFRVLDWPSRWQQWDYPNTAWKILESSNKPYFVNEGKNEELQWLRYRHLVPRSAMDEDEYASQRLGKRRETEWEQIENGKIPRRIKNRDGEISAGALIRDYYEYNDRHYQFPVTRSGRVPSKRRFWSIGAHWVGDLAVESEIVVESDSGTLAFDLVEGGVHFTCEIDIATGKATLKTSGNDDHIRFDCEDENPTAQTPINGHGTYKVMYAQLDDMVYLFVNGRNIEFNGSSYVNTSGKRPIPKYDLQDPGDAEPIGIGAAQANVRVNRLKVMRDIYYVSPSSTPFDDNIFDEIENVSGFVRVGIYEQPSTWNSNNAKRIFDRPVANRPMFELGPDEYFPMGDNSPASQDARIWPGNKSVKEELLIGRAMFIYWPHSLNKPIRFFPNFKRMGFIR